MQQNNMGAVWAVLLQGARLNKQVMETGADQGE